MMRMWWGEGHISMRDEQVRTELVLGIQCVFFIAMKGKPCLHWRIGRLQHRLVDVLAIIHMNHAPSSQCLLKVLKKRKKVLGVNISIGC